MYIYMKHFPIYRERREDKYRWGGKKGGAGESVRGSTDPQIQKKQTDDAAAAG